MISKTQKKEKKFYLFLFPIISDGPKVHIYHLFSFLCAPVTLVGICWVFFSINVRCWNLGDGKLGPIVFHKILPPCDYMIYFSLN